MSEKQYAVSFTTRVRTYPAPQYSMVPLLMTATVQVSAPDQLTAVARLQRAYPEPLEVTSAWEVMPSPEPEQPKGYHKLPAPVKADWLTALESGEYEQGFRKLKYVNLEGEQKYCCLGVLCEVLNDTNRVDLPSHFISEDFGTVAYGECSTTSLPAAVSGYLGIDRLLPAALIPAEAWPFVVMHAKGDYERAELDCAWRDGNDGGSGRGTGVIGLHQLNDAGVPFPVIAQVIRQFM